MVSSTLIYEDCLPIPIAGYFDRECGEIISTHIKKHHPNANKLLERLRKKDLATWKDTRSKVHTGNWESKILAELKRGKLLQTLNRIDREARRYDDAEVAEIIAMIKQKLPWKIENFWKEYLQWIN